MLRFLTAGESHGQALVVTVDGMPAGLQLDIDALNLQLRRRQGGYGRGRRMQIESDRAAPGLGTIIGTRLVLRDDAPVELNYLLRATPAGWKIVDVYLAGTISELARRRAEFSSIIQTQGVDGLIALLKTKNAALAGG